MRLIVCLTIVLTTLTIAVSGEQQRILRRVIKSTPTANQLTRIRAITVRSPNAESGGVTEISSKEAASFGQRSANETEQQSSTNQQQKQQAQQTSSGLKTKFIASTTSAPTTTTSPTSSSTTTTTTTTSTTTSKPQFVENSKRNKASDRQQASQSNAGVEVELLSSAPSSWQTMTAVEAPAAMLIATGTRAASTSDLASAGSTLYSSEESASQTGDFLRASGTKGGSSFQQQQSNNEAFSRLRQQSSKTQQQQQQQQSFFYPQEQRASSGKTSFASKTPWYQTTTTTTPRPAPLIQEQQYEQQNEQYVEQQQQQQVEYGAPAPLGQAEPFAFDFKTQDNSGNGQYRKEESDKNGVVRGSYGYTDASGIYRHVEYVADQNGFRANIKSNEPGLIGETQPASIQLAGGASPARVTSPRASSANNNNNNNDNGGDWISSSASNNQGSSADLALAPPEFESSHKPERTRLPRQYRN